MTELVFISQPSQTCNWVIYPWLLVGNNPEGDRELASEFVLVVNTKHSSGLFLDDELTDLIHSVCSSKKKIYIYDHGDYSHAHLFLVCLLQYYFRYNLNEATMYIGTCLKFAPCIRLTPTQKTQLQRYRRPMVVLMCGDRNSSVAFEEMIDFELKSLPKYSIIVHGGCSGIDLYAAELAKLNGFETMTYPADWSVYGRAAGPIRNKQMLEYEDPDLVIAFHPDISLSRGTKNMMITAWKAGKPVYIHDLKRKMKFEGDFNVL